MKLKLRPKSKDDLGYLIIITDQGKEVRKIKTIDNLGFVDSEGVRYTRPMLHGITLHGENIPGEIRGLTLPNGLRVMIFFADTIAFQRLSELAEEMENIIFAEALSVDTGGYRIVQWVVTGLNMAITFMLLIQLSNFRTAMLNDLALISGQVQQLMALMAGPVRIDGP